MSKWVAWCDTIHGLTYGWEGPERDTEQEAKDDAEKHKRDLGDHEVDVRYDPL